VRSKRNGVQPHAERAIKEYDIPSATAGESASGARHEWNTPTDHGVCLVLSRPLALPPGNHVVGNGRRAPGNAGIVGAELPADPQSPWARLLRR
jgi:hypothetical protein